MQLNQIQLIFFKSNLYEGYFIFESFFFFFSKQFTFSVDIDTAIIV